MDPLDPHAFSVFVRWLHVLAMAVALGGAVLVASLAIGRRSGDVATAQALLAAATRYEWAFWAAAGVLAMSGIGNLADFGGGLPTTTTDWGATFVAKLLIVIGLVTVSVPRTLAVVHIAELARDGLSARGAYLLQVMYAATVAAFAVILALAILLAHR